MIMEGLRENLLRLGWGEELIDQFVGKQYPTSDVEIDTEYSIDTVETNCLFISLDQQDYTSSKVFIR